MRNIIIKKKCLLFKQEKNNQALSNDWPTYCHTGIYDSNIMVYSKGYQYFRVLAAVTKTVLC